MSIINANDQSFRYEVNSPGVVIVDFWAPWCGPCKMLSPIFNDLSNEYGDRVKIVKVNVDENPESASRFGVMSIPNVIFFKDGKPVDRFTGFRSEEQIKYIVSRYEQ